MNPASEDNATTTDEDDLPSSSKNVKSTTFENPSLNLLESTRTGRKIPSLSQVAKSTSFSDLKYR